MSVEVSQPVEKGGAGVFPDHAEAAEVGAAGEMSGLQTFLTRWEMNDLLFSVVRENLRVAEPGENYGARPEPWYAFTPTSWREGWNRTVRAAAAKVGREGAIPAPDFLGAQLLCGGMLALLIAGFSLRRWEAGPEGVRELGRALFLVLAASWYLSATQNPWYWAWALPYLGFTRSRIWWLVSGCALIYYARFWLIYQFPEPFWRGYDGRRFFDEIIIWFEHGPVLAALAVAAVRERFRRGS